jgi:predicted glycoside hydrolase/deacetylase ChbG (UPF0249 family)
MSVTAALAPLLIVNGDDFGLTPGVTRGIVDAYRDGILRSTSMLAVAPAFELAAAMATSGDCDGLGIGAHLALVGEDPPLLSPGEIPSLVDRRGNFFWSWRQFLARAATGRIDPADIRRELSAQLDRLECAGVPLTHLDTHQHLHLWPLVRSVVFDLARDRGIPAIRLTASAGRGAVGTGVRQLTRRLQRAAAAVGVSHPSGFTGLDESGQLDEGRLVRSIEWLAGQNVASAEIGCHPGREDDPERRRYRWGYTWPGELRALCAPGVQEAVARNGFRLGSFADLVAVRH